MRMFVLAIAASLLLGVGAQAGPIESGKPTEWHGKFCQTEVAANELAETYATYGFLSAHFNGKFEALHDFGVCTDTEGDDYTFIVTMRGLIVKGNAGTWQVVGLSEKAGDPPILYAFLLLAPSLAIERDS